MLKDSAVQVFQTIAVLQNVDKYFHLFYKYSSETNANKCPVQTFSILYSLRFQ
jgi:hypothetical protein